MCHSAPGRAVNWCCQIHEVPYQKRSLFEFRLHWPPHVNSHGISRCSLSLTIACYPERVLYDVFCDAQCCFEDVWCSRRGALTSIIPCGRNVGAISKEGEDNGAADLLESDEEDDALAKLADR